MIRLVATGAAVVLFAVSLALGASQPADVRLRFPGVGLSQSDCEGVVMFAFPTLILAMFALIRRGVGPSVLGLVAGVVAALAFVVRTPPARHSWALCPGLSY